MKGSTEVDVVVVVVVVVVFCDFRGLCPLMISEQVMNSRKCHTLKHLKIG